MGYFLHLGSFIKKQTSYMGQIQDLVEGDSEKRLPTLSNYIVI